MSNTVEVSSEAGRYALANALDLHRPGQIDDAPATLEFTRARLIDLPWAELAVATDTDERSSRAAAAAVLRRHFEKGWGLSSGKDPETRELKELFQAGYIRPAKYLGLAELTDEITEAEAKRLNDYRAPVRYEDIEGDGVFVTHASGRLYRLLSDEPIAPEDFQRSSDYVSSWTRVKGVELVSAKSPTEFETIDLRAPFIEDRYKELALMETIATKVAKAADDAIDPAKIDEIVFNREAVAELQQDYLHAKTSVFRIEREKRKLVRQAADMGFELDADGKLYRSVTETITWRPFFPVVSVTGWLFPKRVVRQVRGPSITVDVVKKIPVDTNVDPLAARVAELRGGVDYLVPDPPADPPADEDSGPEPAPGFEVYIFEEGPSGYVTEDGTPLELVMLRCEHDEIARANTVVMLPSYDYRMTGERVVTSYSVYTRPLAGTTAIAFPELEIVENLSYRTAWKHAELGELVSSINLAPGEKRTVTVTRTFDQETSSTSASKSVFDLNSSESSDLATEMERTARNESEVTTAASAEVTAKASWGWGSASAKANASAGKTLKDVGTDMAKTARKASQSVNQQRHEEVESSKTQKTTVHTSDTSVSEIENINQGRSLNLMFYRLYNRFEGRLFLDDLRLRVRSGVEIIAGTGIRAEQTFSMLELAEAIDELSQTPLPMSPSTAQQWEFKKQLATALRRVLIDEYETLQSPEGPTGPGEPADRLPPLTGMTAGNETSSTEVAPTSTLRSVISFGNLANDEDLEDRRGRSGFEDLLDWMQEKLTKMTLHELPVTKDDVLVAAKGLYLDSTVGMRPATEPYSESMRDIEIRKGEAEVAQMYAEAARNHAIARRLSSGGLGAADSASVVEVTFGGQTLTLTLDRPLGGGPWHLENLGVPVGSIRTEHQGRMQLDYRFADALPDWAIANDFAGLEIVHGTTGERITTDTTIVSLGI